MGSIAKKIMILRIEPGNISIMRLVLHADNPVASLPNVVEIPIELSGGMEETRLCSRAKLLTTEIEYASGRYPNIYSPALTPL